MCIIMGILFRREGSEERDWRRRGERLEGRSEGKHEGRELGGNNKWIV